MSAIASALVYTVNFVNLFARRHHLFDIAATDAILIPLKSIQIICLAVPYYYYYYYYFFYIIIIDNQIVHGVHTQQRSTETQKLN